MKQNQALIDSVIQKRMNKNDNVKEFATRNKASPLNKWNKFNPFTSESFSKSFNQNIDGIKLKFKYTTIVFNGRHKNK